MLNFRARLLFLRNSGSRARSTSYLARSTSYTVWKQTTIALGRHHALLGRHHTLLGRHPGMPGRPKTHCVTKITGSFLNLFAAGFSFPVDILGCPVDRRHCFRNSEFLNSFNSDFSFKLYQHQPINIMLVTMC